LIKEKFSTFTGQPGNKTFQLTTEEANALRYGAGYVCDKLIKKLEMSSTDRQFELISLLTNLTGGEVMVQLKTGQIYLTEEGYFI